MAYIYLMLAIAGELIGTTLLKYSNGFKNLTYGVSSILVYGICFFFLAKAMEHINLSLVYATWSGIGIVATTFISIFLFKEQISTLGILGIILTISGVVILNLYGSSH